MLPLKRLILILHPVLLFGGFWDWFQAPQKSQKVDFHCPYHCGEWGSPSIQSLEWEFVQCLYNAEAFADYIRKNHFLRRQDYSVKCYKDFIPQEVTPYYNRPQSFDSKWYRDIADKNEDGVLLLSECIPDRYGCSGCKTATWKIVHTNNEQGIHIGKYFVRTLDVEGYNYSYYRDEDDEGSDDDISPYSQKLCQKNKYGFGNFIDFHNACLQLEDDVLLEQNANRCRYYEYSPFFAEQINSQAAKVIQSVKHVSNLHHNIFLDCATHHASPAAFYNLALDALSKGDYESGLEYFHALFDKVKLDTLKPNLASELYQSKGALEVEVALYDEAIITLSKAIETNPSNKDAYFERAVAYFEKGEYDLSREDFFKIEQKNFLSRVNTDPYLSDYATGLVLGASKGVMHASSEFLPSICNSARGVGNLLWASISHPIDSSKQFTLTVLNFYQFLRSCDKAELAQILVPEMYELVDQWDHLIPKKRGELAGYALGKYGTDILLPLSIVKGAKYVKAYNEIRKAEKFCTLSTLNKSPESRAALEQAAARWNAHRNAIFERFKLDVDSQNKHIRGKHNFLQTKGEWTHPYPEQKLKEVAGRGQKVIGLPGEAGYKERVDFGEVIGYYVNKDTSERIPTTMGIIHYSKEGAHIVPARPK